MDSLKKALSPHSSSKQLTEAAAVTCVKLCKVSTYINILDRNNVVFLLVQNVFNDLKVYKPNQNEINDNCLKKQILTWYF